MFLLKYTPSLQCASTPYIVQKVSIERCLDNPHSPQICFRVKRFMQHFKVAHMLYTLDTAFCKKNSILG